MQITKYIWLHILSAHMCKPNANSPSVRLKFLYFGQLHHRLAHVPKSFGRQV